jgi:tetratricopeptide (TPR) repeat protein
MSRKRRPAEQPAAGVITDTPIAEKAGLPWWVWPLSFLALLILGFEVYGPALNGEFLFDDHYLPFLMPELQSAPLRAWLGVRPLLMLTYWLNYQNSGLEPSAYHAVGIALHCFNAALIWFIVRRFLAVVGEIGFRREILAAFAGGLFLLHPAQTESVAYVTSRSETLSVFFFLLAYAAFLFRREVKLSIGRMIAVLVLFAAACSVKEHTTVLPVFLLLTDYWFTTPFQFEGIRRNLLLYATVALAGAVGLTFVWQVLKSATSAGFKLQDLAWYQYLFTQFRVIWRYILLFLFPTEQNGDYFLPVSHTIFENGAVLGLIALIAVSVIAWRYRRPYPLASFGWFGFLVLLAPTSSIVPIQDVMVERRLYLPFVCLLLITVDIVRRWRPTPALLATALGVVLVLSAAASHNRNKVWQTSLGFWEDVVRKSPVNSRARFQLAFSEWQSGNCAGAVNNYEAASKLTKPDERLFIDWALALECLNQTEEAVAKLREAYAIAPTALVQAQIGMIYGKKGRIEKAMEALDQAERLDPNFDMTYVYKGNLEAARGNYPAAIALYNRALAINPANDTAQKALAIAQQQQRR